MTGGSAWTHWTEWAETTSQDGMHVARTRMGARMRPWDGGRKAVTLRLERLTYSRMGGVVLADPPDRFWIGARGRSERFEIVLDTGEILAHGTFHTPGRLEGGGMVFHADQDLDDGDYVARIRDDAQTVWVAKGEEVGPALIGVEYATAPLPPHQLTFTMEGSSPRRVDPPLPYDDDPYKPSLW